MEMLEFVTNSLKDTVADSNRHLTDKVMDIAKTLILKSCNARTQIIRGGGGNDGCLSDRLPGSATTTTTGLDDIPEDDCSHGDEPQGGGDLGHSAPQRVSEGRQRDLSHSQALAAMQVEMENLRRENEHLLNEKKSLKESLKVVSELLAGLLP